MSDPLGVEGRHYCMNQELNGVLQELLGDDQYYSNSSLISAAKNYIMSECKQYIKLYIDKEFLLDIGAVESIIIFPSTHVSTQIVTDAGVHAKNVLSTNCSF